MLKGDYLHIEDCYEDLINMTKNQIESALNLLKIMKPPEPVDKNQQIKDEICELWTSIPWQDPYSDAECYEGLIGLNEKELDQNLYLAKYFSNKYLNVKG
jgi:hypothetical protein